MGTKTPAKVVMAAMELLLSNHDHGKSGSNCSSIMIIGHNDGHSHPSTAYGQRIKNVSTAYQQKIDSRSSGLPPSGCYGTAITCPAPSHIHPSHIHRLSIIHPSTHSIPPLTAPPSPAGPAAGSTIPTAAPSGRWPSPAPAGRSPPAAGTAATALRDPSHSRS